MDLGHLLSLLIGDSHKLRGLFFYVVSLALSFLMGMMRLEFDSGSSVIVIPIWLLLLIVAMVELFHESIMEDTKKKVIQGILIGVAFLMILVGFLVGLILD